MSVSWKRLRMLFVRKEPPTPRIIEVAMSSEDQREKTIKLLMTAQMLAVDLGDAALVEAIKRAIAQARAGFVRQA